MSPIDSEFAIDILALTDPETKELRALRGVERGLPSPIAEGTKGHTARGVGSASGIRAVMGRAHGEATAGQVRALLGRAQSEPGAT